MKSGMPETTAPSKLSDGRFCVSGSTKLQTRSQKSSKLMSENRWLMGGEAGLLGRLGRPTSKIGDHLSGDGSGKYRRDGIPNLSEF